MKSMFRVIAILIAATMLLTACAAPTAVPPTAAPKAAEPTKAPAAPTAVPATKAPEPTKAPTAVPATAVPAKQKVTIWYDSGAAWNDFIADFNKELAVKNPNITVDWVTQDTAQLSAKLVAAFAAKQGPDIAMGSQYRLAGAEIQYKAWADLAPLAASDPEMKEIVAALPKIHVDSYTREKKIWGLPQVVQSVGLFVRKSWMDKLKAKEPTDWTEMTALAERFTKEDPDGNGKADTFGYCIFGAPGQTNSAGIQFEYSGAAAGMQYPIIDQDGKPTFNTEIGKKVIQWMANWQHKNKITSPDTPTFTHKEFYEVVQAGKCGIGRIGAWNVAGWSKTAIAEDYVVINYPPMNKGDKNNAQTTWSNGITMSATPANKEATLVVLKALMNKAGQTLFYQKLTSSSRVDLDWPKLATKPSLLYFSVQQPSYVLEQAAIDTFNPVNDILSKYINKVLADPKTDPIKALADADVEAQAKYKEIMKK
jgi:multiple sugar transport system substrate-binding protein